MEKLYGRVNGYSKVDDQGVLRTTCCMYYTFVQAESLLFENKESCLRPRGGPARNLGSVVETLNIEREHRMLGLRAHLCHHVDQLPRTLLTK